MHIIFRIVGFFLYLLPNIIVRLLVNGIGFIFYKKSPKKREMLRINLQNVFDYLELGKVNAKHLKKVFQNYTEYFFEVLMLPYKSLRKIKKIF